MEGIDQYKIKVPDFKKHCTGNKRLMHIDEVSQCIAYFFHFKQKDFETLYKEYFTLILNMERGKTGGVTHAKQG